MDERVLPAPDAPAEQWGRLAVAIPGWRWMPGMLVPHRGYGRLDDDDVSDHPLYRLPLRDDANAWPDPDDPATVGCLLALLGEQWGAYHYRPSEHPSHTPYEIVIDGVDDWVTDAATLGRSCIAAAAALGRWPGGGEH